MADAPLPEKIPLTFFRTQLGREPVLDWLKRLAKNERHAIGKDLLRAQWHGPAGMPLCHPLGGGLWEVRTDLSTERTSRVLLCFCRGRSDQHEDPQDEEAQGDRADHEPSASGKECPKHEMESVCSCCGLQNQGNDPGDKLRQVTKSRRGILGQGWGRQRRVIPTARNVSSATKSRYPLDSDRPRVNHGQPGH